MTSLIDYPADDVCLLYLVRHGATEHNLLSPPRLQGAGINGPLAESGRQQAARVAQLLADRPLTDVCASPLLRAVETAEAIAAPHDLPVSTFESLKEVNVGDWEGRTWEDVQANDPDNYAKFRSDPGGYGYPGGENLCSVIERTTQALDGLMRERVGRELAVVAHSVVIRSYMGSLLGLPPEKGYEVQQLNCAVNVVRWKNGRAKAVTINAVGHLM